MNRRLVAIATSATVASAGWGGALAWTFVGNQQITSAWNATISPASGAVTARNVATTARSPRGGNTSFGFQAHTAAST
jgi:hypothetical protein